MQHQNLRMPDSKGHEMDSQTGKRGAVLSRLIGDCLQPDTYMGHSTSLGTALSPITIQIYHYYGLCKAWVNLHYQRREIQAC